MDSEIYIYWLKEKLIPGLDLNSVLLVDNMSCHNTQKDKVPTSNSNKETVQNWLCGRNVDFYTTVLKVQLHEILQAYKPKYESFIVDEIMAVNSHKVLRLPPHHVDLKPVELIWADVKQWHRADNTTFPIDDINPYPTAFPYGNGMVLHFYQQQESSTTKTVHKVINKGLKTYV